MTNFLLFFIAICAFLTFVAVLAVFLNQLKDKAKKRENILLIQQNIIKKERIYNTYTVRTYQYNLQKQQSGGPIVTYIRHIDGQEILHLGDTAKKATVQTISIYGSDRIFLLGAVISDAKGDLVDKKI